MKKLFLYFFMSLFLMSFVFATNRFVATTGNDALNDCLITPCQTIQHAIDQSAVSGDTINVAAGTYNEQLNINKNLAINGDDVSTTIIQAPGVLVADTDGKKGIILIKGLVNVDISGFTISGPGSSTCGSIDYGIAVNGGATLDVTNCNINDIRDNPVSGCQNGEGIRVGTPRYDPTPQEGHATIIGVNVSGYQKNAIVIAGSASTADIQNNFVQPDPNAHNVIASNGIQVTGGAVVNVKNNKVIGNKCDVSVCSSDPMDPDQSVGILLLNAGSGTTVLNNNVSDSDVGIYNLASGTTISNNILMNNRYENLVLDQGNGLVINNNISKSNIGIAVVSFNEATGDSYGNVTGNNISGALVAGIKLLDKTTADAFIPKIDANFNNILGNFIGVDNTITNPADAKNNWWGCNKGPGNTGCDSVSANVDFTPWIGVQIKDKISTPSIIFRNDNVNVYANVTSGVCVGNVIFSLNNQLQNCTGQKSTGANAKIANYYCIINTSTLTGNSIPWTVYADDCYRHLEHNGIESLYITNRTNLTINPPKPGSGGFYTIMPMLTLTADGDNGINGTFYRWDSSPEQMYSVPFNFSERGGVHVLHYWSTFGKVVEPEQTRIVKIDMKSPEIENINPLENANITSNTVTISADIDDEFLGISNSGIDEKSIVLGLDNKNITFSILNISDGDLVRITNITSNLPIGKHSIFVSAKDKAGNPKVDKTWNFTYSPISVDMNVTKPKLNDYYNKTRVRLNITTSEKNKVLTLQYNDDNKTWRTLCSNCNKYDADKTFKEGITNLKLRAIKNFAVANETSVTFSIDSKKPRIGLIEPKTNSYTNGSDFMIKYTEENLKQIVLHLVKDTTDVSIPLTGCVSGTNKICSANVDLSAYDGQKIKYYFVVSDQVNTVESRMNNIKVDTSAPILTVNSPLDGINYLKKIELNVNINEKVQTLEYNDNNKGFRTLCSNCNKYDNSKTLTKGSHNLKVRAIDYAGNSDLEERNFIVS